MLDVANVQGGYLVCAIVGRAINLQAYSDPQIAWKLLMNKIREEDMGEPLLMQESLATRSERLLRIDLHESSGEHGPPVEGNAEQEELFVMDRFLRAMVRCIAVVAVDLSEEGVRASHREGSSGIEEEEGMMVDRE